MNTSERLITQLRAQCAQLTAQLTAERDTDRHNFWLEIAAIGKERNEAQAELEAVKHALFLTDCIVEGEVQEPSLVFQAKRLIHERAQLRAECKSLRDENIRLTKERDAYVHDITVSNQQRDEARAKCAEIRQVLGDVVNDSLITGMRNWQLAAKHALSSDCGKGYVRKTAKVICLCGSTRFTDEMLVKQWELTKKGFIVVSWCAVPDSYFSGPHVGDAEGVKEIVDEVHKRKIDLADSVFVMNVQNYIGESTASEIRYAQAHGKPIEWLNPPTQAELARLEALVEK